MFLGSERFIEQMQSKIRSDQPLRNLPSKQKRPVAKELDYYSRREASPTLIGPWRNLIRAALIACRRSTTIPVTTLDESSATEECGSPGEPALKTYKKGFQCKLKVDFVRPTQPAVGMTAVKCKRDKLVVKSAAMSVARAYAAVEWIKRGVVLQISQGTRRHW